MNSTAESNKENVQSLAGKYLAFALSKEKYAIDILKVQEIIGVLHITSVPKSPEYLKGVINLRGKIIPVVDLRIKFGMPAAPYNEKTCIIVVNVKLGLRAIMVGVIVDTVLEVCSFGADTIEPPPQYGAGLDSNFILGIGRAGDDSMIILIDIEKSLHDESAPWAIAAKVEAEREAKE